MRRLLIVGLALACRSPTHAYDELQVGLWIEPIVVRAGAPATILVTIFNPTRRDAELPLGCSTHFEVTTVNGGVVGPEQPLCTLAAVPTVRLAAGGQHTFVYHWNGTGLGAVVLPSGEYRIRGALYPHCNCGPRSEPATVLIDWQ